MIKILALFLLTSSSAISAQAEMMTGLALREVCESQTEGCHAFIIGHTGAMMAVHSTVFGLISEGKRIQNAHEIKSYCFPNKVAYEQLRLVYLKWANQNPEHLHFQAGLAFDIAMSHAFPCKNYE